MTRGSQFATGRDRTSAPEPGGSGVSREDFLTSRPSPDVVEPADAAGEEVADRAHARCIWDGVVVCFLAD